MTVPQKILIVDDDPAACAHVAQVLSDAGFVCVSAASGPEALARIEREHDVAVVVSDVVMPGVDGVRLGRHVRDRFPGRPWLQVLFVTGRAELELAVSALRIGAVDYLTKPVATDELVEAVGRALAASRAIVARLPSGRMPAVEPLGTGNTAATTGPVTPDAAARSALEYLAALRRLRHDSGVLAGLDEASWTIVLEVYHAGITGRRLSVSKLCALDDASQTTAWRRIRAMEQAGLLLRDQDPTDARRSFMVLTDPAARAVVDFMARADSLIA